jgi:DNA-binding CsgD family transcriptional regulator
MRIALEGARTAGAVDGPEVGAGHSVPPGCPLSSAEFAAIELLARGLTYKQAAAARGVASATVRTQLHNAYKRLGVLSAMHAVIACNMAGWIDVEIPGFESQERLELRRTELHREQLTRALGVLAHEIRERREPELSAAQHSYLDAFDERDSAQRAHDEGAEDEARDRMLGALNEMLAKGPA